MKTQRFAFGLTVLNLAILTFLLIQARSAIAPELPEVLRVRGLELIDDQGRVRALLKVFPADPAVKMPDGTVGAPETVLFRLLDSHGAPNVKIAATEGGSGINLGSATDSYIQILARGETPSLTLVNQEGHRQVIQPQ